MYRKTAVYIISGIVFVALIIAGILLFEGEKIPDEITEERAGDQHQQLWTCGMHPEVIQDEPGNCPKCGMKLVPVKQTSLVSSNEASSMQHEGTSPNTGKPGKKGEREILYWQAPMDPTEIYDRPGKSKMGMDLVPVYADQAGSGSGGSITIDPVTVQNMGVRVAPVKYIDFSRRIRSVGKIVYNEEKLFTINTKISGWIEKLYVDYTGKMVRKGDPLLEIYSPDLVTTQQEYLLALKNRQMVAQSKFQSIKQGAASLLESTRKRFEYWDIPESEIKRLEKTGEVKKTVLLRSPANGVVIHKNAVEGIHVKEGMNLYKIADLSTVWVEASIYDNEFPWIRVGQQAKMELSYLPGETFVGNVSYIYPYLDEKTRDVQIRMEFQNPELTLKPGMYANVWLEGKIIPNALVVPSEAVIRSGERNIVFVAHGEGRFEPREIRTGEEGGSENRYVRVVSGLLDGEQVVTSAQFMLDSESRLQEAVQKMLQERQQRMKPKEESEKQQQKMLENVPGDNVTKQMKNTGHDAKKMDMQHEHQMDMEQQQTGKPTDQKHI